MTRAPVIAAGLLAVGLLFASPAIADALSDGSGQPPPGAPPVPAGPAEPGPEQPPAGAPGVQGGETQPVPQQPANPDPDRKGAPTQVEGPDEPKSPALHRAGREDGGGDGADRPGGRKD